MCCEPVFDPDGVVEVCCFIMVYKPCIPSGYENYWPYAGQGY